MADFARKLIEWQRRHGRHGLPWQGTRDPYRIWLSEIMLQQTQVAAVIPYYERFLARFPNVAALAAASEDEVLQLWSGLGYYARGRNLHASSRIITAQGFPNNLEKIQELPGVGRSTAAAIAVFAFGRRAAILDGNVKRVLARQFGVEGGEQWALAQKLLPRRGLPAYTQALMDLGALLCTRSKPACGRCPVAKDCVALREDRIDELPAARKRKPLPLRRATWLVLQHQRAVLLERREGSVAKLRKSYPVDLREARRLPRIEHGFTHFRLTIQPLYCSLRKRPSRRDGIWLDVEDAMRAAVPAPVKTLLSALLPALDRDQPL